MKIYQRVRRVSRYFLMWRIIYRKETSKKPKTK